MLYVEEIKRQREETEEKADAELLRRERRMERESRCKYKERQRRLKLYMEYHKDFKSLIVPYDVPQDPKGFLYRELKQTYEENIVYIDNIDINPMYETEYFFVSSCILIMILVILFVFFACSSDTLIGPLVKAVTILITLAVVVIYTLICPFFANIFIVRHKIKLAAECEVTCHILEMRNPILRFQDA